MDLSNPVLSTNFLWRVPLLLSNWRVNLVCNHETHFQEIADYRFADFLRIIFIADPWEIEYRIRDNHCIGVSGFAFRQIPENTGPKNLQKIWRVNLQRLSLACSTATRDHYLSLKIQY